MFSSAGAQPISLKSFRGLEHFPNKIARVYKHEHCLPSAFRSWQVTRSGYRCALLARMASSGVGSRRYISPSMENNSAVPAPAARQIRLTADVSGFPNAENGTIASVAAKTIPMIP